MPGAVLVVEDDADIRELIDRTLTMAGYVVATASSGSAALEMLRRTRFDVVLLDVQMPNMSGLDVLEGMRRIGRPMPPVLMVTANREATTVADARSLGCVGYVLKPFMPQDLVGRVRAATKFSRRTTTDATPPDRSILL